MAATYNTIPAGDASDSQTLLPSKPKTSTKFIVVAAAVASFALGAVCNVAVSHSSSAESELVTTGHRRESRWHQKQHGHGSNPKPLKPSPGEELDAYGNVIPADCQAWFDGCNTCRSMEGGFHSCTRKLCGPDDLGAAKCLDETGQQTALFATAGKPAPKAAPKQPQCTDAMGCTDNGCNCQNGGHCDQTHCRNVKQVACNQGGCNQAGVSAKDSVYCSGGCNQKGATALSGIVLCSRHNWGDTCLY